MALIAIFAPLIAAIVARLLYRLAPDRLVQFFLTASLGASAVSSSLIFWDVAFNNAPYTIHLFHWMNIGGTSLDWSFRFDVLSSVMMVVASCSAFLISIYALGYMRSDPSASRFQGFFLLLVFSMLLLVSADNLAQFLFGWIGVGIFTWLLIGFWYEKPIAAFAAYKTIVIFALADVILLLGVSGVYALFGSLEYNAIFALLPARANDSIILAGGEFNAVTVLCILLFIGAMAKSAQIGLHVWLEGAMEAPIPAAAAIASATTFTASLFLVIRLSPLYDLSETALTFLAIIGAITALFGAAMASWQTDIKKILAYAASSQAGFVFMGFGLSAYQAGVFHLFTQAFFQSLLFLVVGSVIYALSGERNIRNMGGLWRHVHLSYALAVVAALALMGVWPFSGYWSKSVILDLAWRSNTLLGTVVYGVGIAFSFLTAFYVARMIFVVFHEKSRADERVMAHIRRSSAVMTAPMAILAAGALFAGILGQHFFVGSEMASFWGDVIPSLDTHQAMESAANPFQTIVLVPQIVSGFAIIIAFLFYCAAPNLPGRIVQKAPMLARLFEKQFYIDVLYQKALVAPIFGLGQFLWNKGGIGFANQSTGRGISFNLYYLAMKLSALQNMSVHRYAFVMVASVILCLLWLVWKVN